MFRACSILCVHLWVRHIRHRPRCAFPFPPGLPWPPASGHVRRARRRRQETVRSIPRQQAWVHSPSNRDQLPPRMMCPLFVPVKKLYQPILFRTIISVTLLNQQFRALCTPSVVFEVLLFYSYFNLFIFIFYIFLFPFPCRSGTGGRCCILDSFFVFLSDTCAF